LSINILQDNNKISGNFGIEKVFKSFEEWISNYIASLENDERVFAPEWGVVKRDSPFNKAFSIVEMS
jgi:hypothetical protein